MKVIIVDDEPLARNELHYLLKEIRSFDLISEAETIQETLELLLLNQYDVVFLDINLMDESGLDMASKINQMPHHPHIIFATAHDTYAVKAFELDATDYILKPFDKSRIEQALAKVTRRTHTRSLDEGSNLKKAHANYDDNYEAQSDKLPVEMEDRIHLLNPQDIIAISVQNGITTINTLKQNYVTHLPLSHYADRLRNPNFLRIHRATIINKKHIETVEHWFNYTYQLTMTNQLKFQVSRSYMKGFKHQLGLD
ncbi:response regulator transcription factor LytR [Staphylococcus sp. SQ8-PEA]|uniref:Response regulator transcription factor LytR n=1 Tax=Staphylococcus marylandisciuri TaxID=2981529 RepID=A0ABT2QMU1_9STAP|nr:response regulator transcription factor LytR [Staphylococcus marylandisciuri]MCU5745303.1 response regulator transcription factor LytR [Staphylococcus marylandisciuri]